MSQIDKHVDGRLDIVVFQLGTLCLVTPRVLARLTCDIFLAIRSSLIFSFNAIIFSSRMCQLFIYAIKISEKIDRVSGGSYIILEDKVSAGFLTERLNSRLLPK